MLRRVSVVEAVASLRLPGDFEKLWAGVTISAVGSQVTVLAVPLTAVLLLGAGPVETGALIAARMAPMVLLGLFVGALVDRMPRRPVLVVADFGRAVLLGFIPLLSLAGLLRMEALYAVSALVGVMTVFFEKAIGLRATLLVGAIGVFLDFGWVLFSPVRLSLGVCPVASSSPARQMALAAQSPPISPAAATAWPCSITMRPASSARLPT